MLVCLSVCACVFSKGPACAIKHCEKRGLCIGLRVHGGPRGYAAGANGIIRTQFSSFFAGPMWAQILVQFFVNFFLKSRCAGMARPLFAAAVLMCSCAECRSSRCPSTPLWPASTPPLVTKLLRGNVTMSLGIQIVHMPCSSGSPGCTRCCQCSEGEPRGGPPFSEADYQWLMISV